jgi:hypothetical protein
VRLVVLIACAALVCASAQTAHAASSGEPLPAGDLDGWRQLLAEDFDTDVAEGSFPGAAYGSRWAVYPDGAPDTTRRGVQAPSTILSVQNSLLTWRFRDNAAGVPQVAVPLPRIHGPGTDPYRGQLYGRYSVRLRSTQRALGYAVVFLLWPDDGIHPDHGEFDYPAGDLTHPIRAFTVQARPDPAPFASMTTATFDSWHTATIEWSPGLVRYLLDGRVIGTSTEDLPSTPMHWVLQTDTTDYGAPPAPGATANLEVDWAAAWAYSPGTPRSQSAPPGSGGATPGATTTTPGPLPRTADGRTVVRVTAGGCTRRAAATVSGRIAVRAPSGARRVVVRLGGRRVRRPARIDTQRGPQGLRRISVRYTPRGARPSRRLAGCRWIRVANR